MDKKKMSDVNLVPDSQKVEPKKPTTAKAKTTAIKTAKPSGTTTKKSSSASGTKTSTAKATQPKSASPKRTTAKISQETVVETEKKVQDNLLMDNSIKEKTEVEKSTEQTPTPQQEVVELVEPIPQSVDELTETLDNQQEQPILEQVIEEQPLQEKTVKKTTRTRVKKSAITVDGEGAKEVALTDSQDTEKSQTIDNTVKSNDDKDFIAKPEEDKKMAKRQKTLKTVLTITFVVLVVGVLIYTFLNDFILSGKETASLDYLAQKWAENWWYLPCAAFSLFLLYFFKAAKLSVMAKSITGRWHFKTCFNTANLGLYMNNVTPLAVGGQPFEIAYLSKHGIHGGVASSLPIATFFLNQLAFVVCTIVALALYFSNALGLPDGLNLMVYSNPAHATISLLSIIGIICCFAVPLVVLLFSMFPSWGASIIHVAMKIGGKLRIVKDPRVKTYKTIKNISHNSRCMKRMITNPVVAISTSLMSICEQLAQASIAYFVLKFFGFTLLGYTDVIAGTVSASNGFVEWAMIVCYHFIFSSAVSFVPTPGNSGGTEISFYLLFIMAFDSEYLTNPMAGVAFPAMLVWRVLCYYAIIVIGFFSNMAMKRKDKKILAQASAMPPDDEKK